MMSHLLQKKYNNNFLTNQFVPAILSNYHDIKFISQIMRQNYVATIKSSLSLVKSTDLHY